RGEHLIAHDLGAPGRDHDIAEPIAPRPRDVRGVGHRVPARATIGAPGKAIVRGDDRRVLDRGDLRDGAARPVPPGAFADRGADHLAGRGAVDGAGQDRVAFDDGDECRPEWNAANKGLRAVDRVDQPAAHGLRALDAEFFADNAILWEALREPLARALLGGAVGDRHRGAVTLRFDDELRVAEVLHRRVADDLRELDHGMEQVYGRHGIPARVTATLMSAIVVTWSCTMPATSAASASSSTAATSSGVPAPPEATTGTLTTCATAFVRSRS